MTIKTPPLVLAKARIKQLEKALQLLRDGLITDHSDPNDGMTMIVQGIRELLDEEGESECSCPELEKLRKDDEILRTLLWLRHGCKMHTLYGDDGEQQCNSHGCMIDFKRMSPTEIRKAWTTHGEKMLNEHLLEESRSNERQAPKED